MTKKIYVASSWKNPYISEVISGLSNDGHQVCDFRAPDVAFTWDELDRNYENWNPLEFIGALELGKPRDAFRVEFKALDWCDACVLVLPCGKSAHLAAGYLRGVGKMLHILLAEGEPVQAELMYKMANGIHPNLKMLREAIR